MWRMYSVACNVWRMGQINYVAYGYVLCGVWLCVMWRMGQMCNVVYGNVAYGTNVQCAMSQILMWRMVM